MSAAEPNEPGSSGETEPSGRAVVKADDVETDPEAVATGYDQWAADYDDDLAAWGYDAPELVAEALAQLQPDALVVLDVGCGTGLSGRALTASGFTMIDGADISTTSLDLAEATGAYRSVMEIDFQQLPTDLADDSYSALTCVGVLTYLPDTEAVLGEFCRIVEPGGTIVFTQRDDLWAERSCADTLDRLTEDGAAEVLSVSEPRQYLPGHADVGHIPVRIVTLKVQ